MRYQPYSTPIKISKSENIMPMLKFIRYHFRHNKKCVEFGSGDISTPFLNNFYDLICIEENQDWMNKYSGVKYIYASIIDGWFEHNTVRRCIPNDYDFIIVDAPCDVNWRANISMFWSIFKRKKPIIIHAEYDVDVLACKQLSEKLNKKYEFITTDNCHFCVIGLSRFHKIKSHIINFFANLFRKDKIKLK